MREMLAFLAGSLRAAEEARKLAKEKGQTQKKRSMGAGGTVTWTGAVTIWAGSFSHLTLPHSVLCYVCCSGSS